MSRRRAPRLRDTFRLADYRVRKRRGRRHPSQNSQSRGDVERFLAAFDCAQTLGVEARLRELRAPTLVVWGTDDVFFDVRWSHWLAETIPGVCRRIELAGAHLLFPEERPDELNAELRRHWTAVEGER